MLVLGIVSTVGHHNLVECQQQTQNVEAMSCHNYNTQNAFTQGDQ